MNPNDLISQLTRDLKPVKPLASNRWRFFMMSLMIIISTVGGIIYWYIKKEEFNIPAGRSTFEGIALLACAWVSGWLATKSVSPHHSSVKTSRTPLYLFALWAGILLIAFSILLKQTPSDALIALEYNTWLCPMVILTITIPAAILTALYLQKGAILFPKTTFFYWATMATTIGALGLSFICPWRDPLHEILWHVVPSILFIGIGYLVMTNLYKLLSRFSSRKN